MRHIEVGLGERSYPIYIGQNLLEDAEIITKHIISRQVMIVTNETVAPLYLNKIEDALRKHSLGTWVLPDGENHKSMDSAMKVFDALLKCKMSRGAHILALGGGVVGDLAGFVAACYQRGIPFIQVPTTLLAQVDSSVGGKTAVNHPLGKNMIGAFYQPQCVIADTNTLLTLPEREFSAGLAEVIKYGLIRDPDFFEWLEFNMDDLINQDLDKIGFCIERSCQNKAEVVSADERESGIRATLNLGHTFGHAVEIGMGYGEVLHGEAVAIGICLAADLSNRLGWLTGEEFARIVELLKRARLPIIVPPALGVNDFLEHMSIDKKNVEGQLRLILLEKIGRATLPMAVDQNLLVETLTSYGKN